VGRALVDSDERPSSPLVAVIGFEMWRTRFASDSRVIGQPLQLGRTTYTIVGVMPQGFAFPAYHSAWVPFRLNALEYPARQGPEIARVFGRLAPGVSLDEAQAALNAIAQRHPVE